MQTYRCLKCGHVGAAKELPGGARPTTTCAACGSFDLEPVRAADAHTVPLRVLHSAESQALRWKKQYEGLSRVVNAAIKDGSLPAHYAGEARRVMAGVA